jgi:alpha-beta hydrolase superfamily lysophospholipase
MERFRLKSGYDDLNIAVGVCRPKTQPWAVVQLVHGMCGCKERFEPVMDFLSDNGIVCIANDHRGHGESVKDIKDLGYFYAGGYKGLVADARAVTDWGLKEFPGLPYYLLGHSMGSLAARIYVKQDDSALSGLIVCGSPSWNPMSVIGRILTGAACMIGLDRSRPGFLQTMTSDRYNRRFASEGPQAWTCSDPEVRRSFRENPRCNFRFTMNGANSLMKMMGETYCHKGWMVSQPKLPILFISGSEDPCMISEEKFYNAVEVMHKVGYQNVRFLIYPKMRHEILHEVGKQSVWSDVLDFIKITQK